jgi:hypothetical protein
MLTFEFDHDDPWIQRKLGYLKNEKANPLHCYVPKDFNTCKEMLAFLRLKNWMTQDINEVQSVYT